MTPVADGRSATESASAGLAGQTVLLTGGRGYIAAALLRRLSSEGCAVRRALRPEATAPGEPDRAGVSDVRGDLLDPAFWSRALEGVNIVFHLAAQTSTYVANADPGADLLANVMPVVRLLEACRRRGGTPRVVLAGTVTQAGVPLSLPVDESAPDSPATVYDLHKLFAEHYVGYASRAGDVFGVTLRLANVYGPGPASSSSDRGILNLMMRRALRGEALTVYGDGLSVRDYVHVDDVACAFLSAALAADRLSGQHFVIGSGVGTRIVDAIGMVADRVAAHTGTRPAVLHVAPPANLSPIESRDFVADSSAFTRATGWRPRYDLPGGIDHSLEAFLAESGRGK